MHHKRFQSIIKIVGISCRLSSFVRGKIKMQRVLKRSDLITEHVGALASRQANRDCNIVSWCGCLIQLNQQRVHKMCLQAWSGRTCVTRATRQISSTCCWWLSPTLPLIRDIKWIRHLVYKLYAKSYEVAAPASSWHRRGIVVASSWHHRGSAWHRCASVAVPWHRHGIRFLSNTWCSTAKLTK